MTTLITMELDDGAVVQSELDGDLARYLRQLAEEIDAVEYVEDLDGMRVMLRDASEAVVGRAFVFVGHK